MLPEDQLYPGQAFVQVCLLLLALICVPWMLCTKPYLLYRDHQRIKAQGYQGLGGAAREDDDGQLIEEQEEHVRRFYSICRAHHSLATLS